MTITTIFRPVCSTCVVTAYRSHNATLVTTGTAVGQKAKPLVGVHDRQSVHGGCTMAITTTRRPRNVFVRAMCGCINGSSPPLLFPCTSPNLAAQQRLLSIVYPVHLVLACT